LITGSTGVRSGSADGASGGESAEIDEEAASHLFVRRL